MSLPREQRIERIFVAFDVAGAGRATLDAAAGLAAALDAELAGFFLEDVNLLRAAALSFTRESGAASGVSRPMELGNVERALRAQARSAQTSLANVAQGLQLRWSFTTLRGAGIAPLLALADEDSLTVMPPRIPFSWLPVRRRSARSDHVAGQGAVVVLYDGSQEGLDAVQLGAVLARRRSARLTVALSPGESGAMDAYRERLETARSADVPAPRYVALAEASPKSAAAAARGEGAALVIVGSSAWTSPETLSALLARLDCPLVIVR